MRRVTRWAFMEKFVIGPTNDPYLTRWRLVQTPLASVYLHKMSRPDRDPVLHDHPWSFLSIVLWGGYTEVRLNNITRTTRERLVRRLNFMRPYDYHYISALRKPTAWTLLFVGPKVRTFGFLHPKEDGLWEWERYDRVPVDAA